MSTLRALCSVVLGLSAALEYLVRLGPPWLPLYLALAGVAVLPGMWRGLW